MGFFAKAGNYIEAKNKLKELLYNSETIDELRQNRQQFNIWVYNPDNLKELSLEEKDKIIKDADTNFEQKIRAMGFENTIKDFFS